MKKNFLFIFVLCSWLLIGNAWAKTFSLSEYNRNLKQTIIEGKHLSPAQMKELEIRLNMEITSADDISYKQGELIALMNDTTLYAFLNNDKKLAQLLKKRWSQLLKLPNNYKIKFKIDELVQLNDDSHHKGLGVSFLNYYTSFIPQNYLDVLYEITIEKCNLLAYIQDDANLMKCVNDLVTYAGKDPRKVLIAKWKRIQFSMNNHNRLDQLKNDVNNFIVDMRKVDPERAEKIKNIILLAKLKQKDDKYKDAEVEKIKSSKKGSVAYHILIRYYLNKNNIEQAAKYVPDMASYQDYPDGFGILAAYYYAAKDYRRAIYYLEHKIKEEQKRPLNYMRAFVMKLLIQKIMGASTQSPDNVKAFKALSDEMTEYKVKDSLYSKTFNLIEELMKNDNKFSQQVAKDLVEKAKSDFGVNEFVYTLLDDYLKKIDSTSK